MRHVYVQIEVTSASSPKRRPMWWPFGPQRPNSGRRARSGNGAAYRSRTRMPPSRPSFAQHNNNNTIRSIYDRQCHITTRGVCGCARAVSRPRSNCCVGRANHRLSPYQDVRTAFDVEARSFCRRRASVTLAGGVIHEDWGTGGKKKRVCRLSKILDNGQY